MYGLLAGLDINWDVACFYASGLGAFFVAAANWRETISFLAAKVPRAPRWNIMAAEAVNDIAYDSNLARSHTRKERIAVAANASRDAAERGIIRPGARRAGQHLMAGDGPHRHELRLRWFGHAVLGGGQPDNPPGFSPTCAVGGCF
ncbi:MAG: hypothetical protein FJX52_04655 [Alphaproteobacteria bacterium]|nr:hypothetical protein [Alphaproteobacteria bacterium]